MPPEQAKYINFVTLYDIPEASEEEVPVEGEGGAKGPSVDEATVEYAIIYSPMAYASFYNSVNGGDDDELDEPEPVGESVEGEGK